MKSRLALAVNLVIIAGMLLIALFSLSGEVAAEPIGPMLIQGDADLLQHQIDHGWLGAGTSDDPIIIDALDIDAGHQAYGLRVEDTTLHVTIRDSSFQNAEGSTPPYNIGYGLLILNAENVNVENCAFLLDNFGIGIIGSSRVSVTSCSGTVNDYGAGIIVDGRDEVEIVANYFSTSSFGASIIVRNSQFCMLQSNNVTGAYGGLVLEDSSFIDATGTRSYGSLNNAVDIVGCDNVSISWSVIDNVTNNNGIWLYLSDNVTLHNNTISNTGLNGVYVEESRHCAFIDNAVSLSGQGDFGGGNGMWLGGSHFLVSRNHCLNNPGYGMALKIADGTVRDNLLVENNVGIYVDHSSDLLVERNDMVGNYHTGLYGFESTEVRFVNNLIDSSTAPTYYGIMFMESVGCTAERNTIEGMMNHAVYASRSTDLLVDGNLFVISGEGGIFMEVMSSAIVSNNDIQGEIVNGICVRDSEDIEVVQNTAPLFVNGIEITTSSGIRVEGNDCSGSTRFGIYVSISGSYNSATVMDNECTGCGERGIMLSGGSYCVIEGNDCSYSPAGIYVYQSYIALIGNNTCLGNDNAIYLYTADGSTIWGGAIMGTAPPASAATVATP